MNTEERCGCAPCSGCRLEDLTRAEARLAAVLALCDDDRFKYKWGQMRKLVRTAATEVRAAAAGE